MKFLFFAILSVIILISCNSDDNTAGEEYKTTVYQWGTEGEDYAVTSKLDNQDNLYTLVQLNARGYFLTKFDSDLKKLWEKKLEQKFATLYEDIAVRDNNIYILSGVTLDKMNENGEISCSAKLETRNPENESFTMNLFSKSVRIDNQNNIYVAGITYYDLNTSETLPNHSTNTFLIKLDNNCNELWRKQWKIDRKDHPINNFTAMETDDENNIYILGYTNGSINGNEYSGNDYDNYLIKLDDSGNEIWSKQWYFNKFNSIYNYAKAFTLDKQKNIYIAYPLIVEKWDNNMNKLWEVQFGNPPYVNTPEAITLNSYGDVFLAGQFFDGDNSCTLIKINNKQEIEFKKGFSETSSTSVYGKSVNTDQYDNIYTLGYGYGDMKGNKNQGEEDVFVIKMEKQ